VLLGAGNLAQSTIAPRGNSGFTLAYARLHDCAGWHSDKASFTYADIGPEF
jgi:hypothetical protein